MPKKLTDAEAPVDDGKVHIPIKKDLTILSDMEPYEAKKAIDKWLSFNSNQPLKIYICTKYILIEQP